MKILQLVLQVLNQIVELFPPFPSILMRGNARHFEKINAELSFHFGPIFQIDFQIRLVLDPQLLLPKLIDLIPQFLDFPLQFPVLKSPEKKVPRLKLHFIERNF